MVSTESRMLLFVLKLLVFEQGFGHKGHSRGNDSWKFKQIQDGQAHSNSIAA